MSTFGGAIILLDGRWAIDAWAPLQERERRLRIGF
jgi:hypothetical protein